MEKIEDVFCGTCRKHFDFSWFTIDNVLQKTDAAEASKIALQEFVRDTRSPLQFVTARLDKIRKCKNDCGSKLERYLSNAFRMSFMWFTKWCRKSGSYFGCEDTYDENQEEVDGHNSWFRFEIKQTDEKYLWFDDPKEKKDYQWWNSNLFVHWDSRTGHSTMLLVDPLPMVQICIEKTLQQVLNSPAQGLGKIDLTRSPYYVASLFSDVATLIQHQGNWGIRDLIRRLEKSRNERLKDNPKSEVLHEALRHTIHVREILETQVHDFEDILAAHERWLKDHSEQDQQTPSSSAVTQPISTNASNPTPASPQQNAISSTSQQPASAFSPGIRKRPTRMTNQQISQRLHNVINALRSQLNRARANESRLNTEISRSYHMLQADISFASQEDSSSMRQLAVLGTAILPSTFVATLFSTSFFGTDNDGNWVYHGQFWMFWATAVPLTIFSLMFIIPWRYYIKKFLAARQRRQDERSSDMQQLINTKDGIELTPQPHPNVDPEDLQHRRPNRVLTTFIAGPDAPPGPRRVLSRTLSEMSDGSAASPRSPHGPRSRRGTIPGAQASPPGSPLSQQRHNFFGQRIAESPERVGRTS